MQSDLFMIRMRILILFYVIIKELIIVSAPNIMHALYEMNAMLSLCTHIEPIPIPNLTYTS